MSRNSLPPAFAGDAFVAASLGDRSAIRNAHWRPGLAPARHSEIFASAEEAGGTGAAVALALDGLRSQGLQTNDRRGMLWVQDRASIRLTGRPYRPGLPGELCARMIHVAAKNAEDVLFALEEGLRCRDLLCVIGELAGNPKTLGLTASRRLSLAAERHCVPLFLVRHDARRDLSSARMRWEVHSAPSQPPRWNPAAPGAPAWRAELFRARAHTEGQWILHDDGHRLVAEREVPATTPDHGDLARAAGDRSLAAKTLSA
jgi:protein ImuA